MSDLTPIVELRTDVESSLGTLGSIWVHGARICDTLELPYKNNAEYVSCIPRGAAYGLLYQYSFHFRRVMWHIVNVPNRKAIEIHVGNSVRDTEGCVLVGLERIVTPDAYYVLHSIDAFQKFDDTMKPYRDAGCTIAVCSISPSISTGVVA